MFSRRCNFFLALALLTVFLQGCSSRIEQRGKALDPKIIETLKPNVHTREDVFSIMGSPSSVSAFDENVWLYTHRTVEVKSFYDPKVTDQKQLILTFGPNGILKSVESQENEKIKPAFSDRSTKPAGEEPSFFRQIFGSYGRFAKKNKPD